MIDVNKITSTLAKLPDQQLQQYAQMHKNDPYIMALAMSESNRRKEMRAAGQDMQEQPKVVDQMVAEMAPQQMPEDQGIGQLPAGDMNFAGGGIIAFADGGDVERYQFGGNTMGGFTPDFAQAELASSASAMQTQETQRARTLAELEQKVAFLTNAGAPQAAAARAQLEAFKASGQSALPAAAQFTPAAVSPAAPVDAGREGRRTSPVAEGIGTNVSPNLIPASARAKAKVEDKAPPAPGGKPAAPAADKASVGLDALTSKFTRESDLAQGALRNQRVGLSSLLEKEATDEAAAVKKRIKDEGDVFAGKEARLAKREQGITGMQDQNLGLALLQAGASIMTTPGNIGMAVGEGVKVGSKSYIAGIDKINAAKEKFAEARDRLDDLRQNRSDMNNKDIQAAERAIRNSRIQGQQLMLDGATNDLKISTDNQRAIFTTAADAIQTDKKVQAQLESARISANRPNEQMQIAMALGNNNLEAGLRKVAEIQAGKFSVSNSYADYLKAFAGKETITPPLTFANYAAQFGATLPR